MSAFMRFPVLFIYKTLMKINVQLLSIIYYLASSIIVRGNPSPTLDFHIFKVVVGSSFLYRKLNHFPTIPPALNHFM